MLIYQDTHTPPDQNVTEVSRIGQSPMSASAPYLRNFLAVLWAGGGAIALLLVLATLYFAVATRTRPLTAQMA